MKINLKCLTTHDYKRLIELNYNILEMYLFTVSHISFTDSYSMNLFESFVAMESEIYLYITSSSIIHFL